MYRELPSQDILNNAFEDIGFTVRRKANNKIADSINAHGYYIISFLNRRCLVHRILHKMRTGYEPPVLDHINGNRLDNAPANLRAADMVKNAHNSTAHKDNSSGFKGVNWHKHRQQYRVRVMHNGVDHFGGYFDDINAATNKATAMRNQLHGEFANHTAIEIRNKIQEVLCLKA